MSIIKDTFFGGAEKKAAKDGSKVVVRWHDAGDFFSPQYLALAYGIARAFPKVEFYAYTKLAGVAQGEKPANFRQNFSQVTNPPIDSLREFRVMSLKTRFGNLKNVLDEDSSQTEIVVLNSPFVGNAQWDLLTTHFNADLVEIDCSFAPGTGNLNGGLARIRAEAEDAVRSGAGHIVLTDQHSGANRVGMPMIVATSAVHSHLTRKGLRTFCSLNVRSAECMDAHYFAVLVGCGATVVNAYLAEDSLADRISRGLLEGSLTDAVKRYREAIDQGLLKIMAKMGISVISSYRGGLNFEAVGLSRAMCAEYFPGMTSRISGIGVTGIQGKAEAVHAQGWQGDSVLPIGGFYKSRKSGETHAWEATSMHMMQTACNRASYAMWKQYSAKMKSNPPIHLRDLLDIKPMGAPVPLEEVESITSIRKRFVTPGMSLGALSPEAHKTLNVAMNRIGAKSDSGEGGEDPRGHRGAQTRGRRRRRLLRRRRRGAGQPLAKRGCSRDPSARGRRAGPGHSQREPSRGGRRAAGVPQPGRAETRRGQSRCESGGVGG